MEKKPNTPLRIEHFKDDFYGAKQSDHEKQNTDDSPTITIDELMKQNLPNEYKMTILDGLSRQTDNPEDKIEILQAMLLLEKDETKWKMLDASLRSLLES